MKAEKIIKQLREGKTVSEIAEAEKVNRHSVSLVKQTLEILEKEKDTELRKLKSKMLIAIAIISLLSLILLLLLLACRKASPIVGHSVS